ncbi:mannose-6-phosphate isomerase, class I [Vibrio diazotrophicus]|uniref:mannose-6-phosphate isomerase, class I n=1 Tax=Vibrio diazotrophicus TaxID=685 RepID=UPI000C9EC0AC|nr:mannose-6-phosphate isomerase, class I [Vibrio diazotrophicus]PNH93701.1 mannose-6-phosphate isomerase, class I [Vibrio diazotrophicus]
MSDLTKPETQTLQTTTSLPMFFVMNNLIQNYAWGSTTSINQLFGIDNPASKPQAEIWMGAHPNGCSTVLLDGEETKLSTLISKDMNAFLSKEVATRFGEFPYLFKVLAAEKALSIQVHPNKRQAELGFVAEEQQGVPLTAANRNYKDPNHKPELVYALTEYQAMNGFRPISEIINFFSELAIPELQDLVNDLIAEQTPTGLANFFSGLLSLEGEQKEMALTVLLAQASIIDMPLFDLISDLEEQYPGDIGLFAPLILNVITLAPGQAMFLNAETPHAYLKGTGLEIMANSDNVLRAGLTPKYIDVKELVACTHFSETPFDNLLLAPIENNGVLEYPIPVDDFKFSIILSATDLSLEVHSAEILLPLDFALVLTHANGETCILEKGQSVFIPAYAQKYTIRSQGRVARAYC